MEDATASAAFVQQIGGQPQSLLQSLLHWPTESSSIVDRFKLLVCDIRPELAALFYLFGTGCGLVASIVAGSPEATIFVIAITSLVVYLLPSSGFIASTDAGPRAATLFSLVAFPLGEALCVWLNRRRPHLATWEYNLSSQNDRLIPWWLIPLWGIAGAFAAALYDVASRKLSILFGMLFSSSPSSSAERRTKISSTCRGRSALIVSSRRIVMGVTVAFVLLLAAALAIAALNSWIGTRASTWGMVALLFAGIGMLVYAQSNASSMDVFAALASAAAIGVVFPLLEALCCRTNRSWTYHTPGNLSGLHVPPWLFPLWSIVALAILQVTFAARVFIGH